MEAKNIDDILVQSMSDQLPGTAEPPPVVASPDPVKVEVQDNNSNTNNDLNENVSRETLDAPQSEPEKPQEKSIESSSKSDDSPIDEYGNPIAPPKMYSEQEVQNMIRERLSRGRRAEQALPNPAQVKQIAQDFEADPNSDESWQDQLNKAIDNRIETRQRELSEQQWRAQEAQNMAEFQDKFSSGMTKYSDFHSVVSNKPVDNDIMLATRHLDNPAAFVYGACKLHPQEIERISKISDPYIKAAEVGRLHERMVKERKVISAASKPLESPKGDMPSKVSNQPSIDQRIHQHANQKLKRK